MNVVVFQAEGGARVLKDPPNLEELKANNPCVLVDPELSEVWGIPPHLWCERDGKVTHLAIKDNELQPLPEVRQVEEEWKEVVIKAPDIIEEKQCPLPTPIVEEHIPAKSNIYLFVILGLLAALLLIKVLI